MKIKITKWKSMTWHWLNKEKLENKEIEVLKVEELMKGNGLRKRYLIQEPNRYVSARDCVVVG